MKTNYTLVNAIAQLLARFTLNMHMIKLEQSELIYTDELFAWRLTIKDWENNEKDERQRFFDFIQLVIDEVHENGANPTSVAKCCLRLEADLRKLYVQTAEINNLYLIDELNPVLMSWLSDMAGI